VLGEIDVDEFGKRQAGWNSLLAADTVEFALERLDRIRLSGEPAALHPAGIASSGAVAECPLRLAVPSRVA
jgi:hypothetical protein